MGQGVQLELGKISATKDWPIPHNLKKLHAFLGLTGYYRRFNRSYASIANPLTNLLKKDRFVWDSATIDAFEKLKLTLLQAPILGLPNFKKQFIVETDASGSGVGAVLL